MSRIEGFEENGSYYYFLDRKEKLRRKAQWASSLKIGDTVYWTYYMGEFKLRRTKVKSISPDGTIVLKLTYGQDVNYIINQDGIIDMTNMLDSNIIHIFSYEEYLSFRYSTHCRKWKDLLPEMTAVELKNNSKNLLTLAKIKKRELRQKDSCIINMDYNNCSSKEYGLTCDTCVNNRDKTKQK